MSINHLFKQLSGLANSPIMPVMFIGHGTPMNVLPNNPYHDSWRDLGASLGKPQAILCVSAHWTTREQTTIYSQGLDTPRYRRNFGGYFCLDFGT